MEPFLISWTNFISLTFIGFVGILFTAKLYIKLRSNFKILVNCWFCNQNTKVGYEQYNSWDCPQCGQYNGFTEDGDYNREILGQYMSQGLPLKQEATGKNASSSHNGFCQTCNDNQSIKMGKLAAFEPEREGTFTEELGSFRDHLEETYRLCQRCENNLAKILADKKKMVLGLRLAQKIDEIPNEIKQFAKPAHIYISTRAKLINRISIAILLIFAIINWVNIIGSLKINREKLNEIYGPIMGTIIFVAISHLTALTKVLTSYCKSALNFHFFEKCLLFVRTIFILLAYTVGIDFYRHAADFGLVLQNFLPFGSMFLAFGLHLLDGFKVTRTTYLLGLWSVYTTLLRDGISQEYYFYKVLASLAILLLSLPSFSKKNELDRILDNTANSFHRIHSEDYLHDHSNTILNSSRSPHNTLNLSKSSDETLNHSNDSISPVHLAQSSCKSMTSSTLNLIASPISAFKSYSTEQLLPRKAGSPLSDNYTFKPMSKHYSINVLNHHNLNNSLHSPRHYDTLNKTIDSTPNRSFVSCAASISSRQNLLSPSHFGGNNSSYCTAYASQQQPSWVSGGFFNHDKVGSHKNYFLNDITSNESISRGSSQSSGFESHTSSVQPASDRLFSRENSVGHGDVDHLSVYSELNQPHDLPSCGNSLHNKSFEERQRNQFNGLLIPTQTPFRRPNNNIFRSNAMMDFESHDHWVRNSPIDLRRQVFHDDYLANLTVDCSVNSNPFDLNGMTSFLPPVRKRYNLLGSISENRGIRQQFQTDTQ